MAAVPSVPSGERARLARVRLLRTRGGVLGALVQALVVRGASGPAPVEAAGREGGVLFVGAGRRGPVRRAPWPSVSHHRLAHAVCPVPAVPPSPLPAAPTAARRGAFRLPLPGTGRR
ncbi:universal stress protein [Streptomyces griseoviridis]|uniref:universal stress protein n=1 Tax=Streptomyces griseoviridis TaxID=45398 RepID=UPI001E5475D1|nr:universal stress protein [Streptomyces niveoruber]